MIKRVKFLLGVGLVSSVLFLAGCGQTGPLYLPEESTDKESVSY